MQAVTHKLNLLPEDLSRVYLNIDTYNSRVQEFCIASRRDLNVLVEIQHMNDEASIAGLRIQSNSSLPSSQYLCVSTPAECVISITSTETTV